MTRFGTLFILAAFVIAAFTQMNTTKEPVAQTTTHSLEAYKFPKKVQAVIDKSCYGCHSEEGKSDKAKDKLRWDKMQDYDKAQLVKVMDDIIEVIEKKDMPPAKFLEKMPDMKPTDKEYETLSKWAEKEADKLME